MKALIILILLLASCAREQPGIYITDRERVDVVKKHPDFGMSWIVLMPNAKGHLCVIYFEDDLIDYVIMSDMNEKQRIRYMQNKYKERYFIYRDIKQFNKRQEL